MLGLRGELFPQCGELARICGTKAPFRRFAFMDGRILVVEDDLLNRMFYHEVLSGSGYEVEQVSDGALVLDEVARFKPDAITMDIQLPNISGLRLIRKLQSNPETHDIPILAITAFAGRGEEERIRAAGAKAYLAKPVTIPKLLGEVETMLGARV